jgi:8-oxo-dGTP pyrophosphatase MutT (NUDIX family)
MVGNGAGGKKWLESSRRKVLECGVFTVTERENLSPDGRRGRFTVLEAPDWATVVPLVDGPQGPSFLMVRQYRHGAGEVCVEFPGGVVEPGEDPRDAALRELAEETAHKAGRLIHAGSLSPNPAIMANRFHVFVALDLVPEGAQELDEHEIVDAFLVPVAEVRAHMGEPPYSHALMACALLLADRSLGKA